MLNRQYANWACVPVLWSGRSSLVVFARFFVFRLHHRFATTGFDNLAREPWSPEMLAGTALAISGVSNVSSLRFCPESCLSASPNISAVGTAQTDPQKQSLAVRKCKMNEWRVLRNVECLVNVRKVSDSGRKSTLPGKLSFWLGVVV